MSNIPPPDNQLPSILISPITEGLKRLRSQPLLFGVIVLLSVILAFTIGSSLGWPVEIMVAVSILAVLVLVVCVGAYVLVQKKDNPLTHLPQNTSLSLKGYVYFTNNKVVRNAKVYGKGVIQEGYTNDIGAFEVQVRNAESWELFAEYNQLISEPVKINKEAAGQDVVLKIEVVEAEVVIRGTVIDDKKNNITGAIITVVGLRNSVTSDQNGYFEITVPRKDSWIIQYKVNNSTQERTLTPADLENLRLVFTNQQPEVIIKGTVVDDKGRLINGAVITFVSLDASTTTNRDGYFKVAVPQQNSWVIQYTLNNSTQKQTLTPADLENLRLVFTNQEPPPPPPPDNISPPIPSGRSEAEIQAILNDRIERKNWLIALSPSELEEIIFELGIPKAHLSQGYHAQRVLDLLGYVERHSLNDRFKAVCEKKLRGIG